MVRAVSSKARGRWFESRWRHIFSLCIFGLLPVALSSANPMQMKSNMTFIHSNTHKEINLILHKNGEGLYEDLSALAIFFLSDL